MQIQKEFKVYRYGKSNLMTCNLGNVKTFIFISREKEYLI